MSVRTSGSAFFAIKFRVAKHADLICEHVLTPESINIKNLYSERIYGRKSGLLIYKD